MGEFREESKEELLEYPPQARSLSDVERYFLAAAIANPLEVKSEYA